MWIRVERSEVVEIELLVDDVMVRRVCDCCFGRVAGSGRRKAVAEGENDDCTTTAAVKLMKSRVVVDQIIIALNNRR